MDRQLLFGSTVLGAVLFYVFPLMLDTPLSDPDEGLHASISQEMVDTGDYLIPRSLGTPFLDKPILFFTAQAASLRLLGMNEAAARLPGLIFSLLGVLTTALLARRLLDDSTALLSAVIAISMVLPMTLAQAAVHDVALVPITNLLLLCLWEIRQPTTIRLALRWGAAAIALVALALLTKGLLGVALVAVGFGLFVITSRELTWSLTLRCTVILFAGALLASPWFFAMESASPGYLRYYFLERHFFGFATETQRHGNEPWYYYLPILLGGGMPWVHYPVAWLGLGLFSKRSEQRQDAHQIRFLLCVLLGGLLFLSLAGSKLLTYALPLFPAIAILTAIPLKQLVDRTLPQTTERLLGWLFRITCAFGCITPFALLFALREKFDAPSRPATWLVVSVAAGASATALVLYQRQRFSASMAVGSLWAALISVAVVIGPGQTILQKHTQRGLAEAINELPRQPDHVHVVGDRIGSLVFYLNQDLRRRFRAGGITEGKPEAAVMSNRPSANIIVAVDSEWAAQSSGAKPRFTNSTTEAGHFQIARFDNWIMTADRTDRSKTQ